MRPSTGLAPLLLAMYAAPLAAQQVPDRAFMPSVTAPAWPAGDGPAVCLDEGHHNFHTLEGRYAAFGALLTRDGARVTPLRAPFSAATLAPCTILVIANAQPSDVPWERYPIPTPSAFTAAEVDAVRTWVAQGGALFLIADHMPLAGAASALAQAFGVTFVDGFAGPPAPAARALRATMDRPALFARDDESLRDHAIVRGLVPAARISRIRTFTGQAFEAPRDAAPVLVVPQDWVMLLPERAWQFTDTTRAIPVGGWAQGLTLRPARGRVAIFGEAAMFSAQRAGPQGRPMGFNAPGAEQNAQFTLNVVHWLAGRLPDR
ncbi:MAG: DUF4350 domain-containing protein [Gemmatimonadaceae bacterium]|jgi:hypothetical protein|nr:DUF4350 domain-containing protein [Gemmatimonadaceae bacterium]